MNYIFQVGIDFGQTRCIVTLIDRVLEENLIPRIDMALQKTPLSFTKNMAPNQYTAPDIAKIWLLITIAPEYASILPLVQVYCKVELALELTKMAVIYIHGMNC